MDNTSKNATVYELFGQRPAQPDGTQGASEHRDMTGKENSIPRFARD